MGNFAFLEDLEQYRAFAQACIDAEGVYPSSPELCAIGCRRAMELAVKWVYRADETIQWPYQDNLNALLHEETFRDAVVSEVWKGLVLIKKLGNHGAHTGKPIQRGQALAALKALFEFVQWIDCSYGDDFQDRLFDEKLIPSQLQDAEKLAAQQRLLEAKDQEIQGLLQQVAQMSQAYTKARARHQQERTFRPRAASEWETRQVYIDVDMASMGWRLEGPNKNVQREYPVEDMAGVPGQRGFCDYVLFGRDGLPLAVVEAKRESKDPQTGRRQALLYADALERKFGRRPMMFVTNGFETYFWDDQAGPERKVFGIFSEEDLERLMLRRSSRMELTDLAISDKITDRPYQKEAIGAVCGDLSRGLRKHLLVMATGTGKTRTAASLVEVLSRKDWITNVLFLADRRALVNQALEGFKSYLPHMTRCNLCSNREDPTTARIVFSTYPTMLNAIDDTRSDRGRRLFTPAHFDLIIVDESHRSIFKKYRAIFDYFDAYLVGLTATPKNDVARNTYDFFEKEPDVPTFAYEYERALQDKVLVPYYNYEVKTKFLEEGIAYDDLSDQDKERYEQDFTEDGSMPAWIPSAALNSFIFNEHTIKTVLEDLMARGIKVAGGDRLGKTIVFAQSKLHAELILDQFNKLYPHLRGGFAQRVLCDDSYVQTVIDDFKQANKNPHIVVSVDMMDTGIDVPECVNLVFFKKVRSKTKFWQMIGRGTRLCKGLRCLSQVSGGQEGGGAAAETVETEDKERFLIFDYCGNFEFFRTHQETYNPGEVRSLSERIFGKRIKIAVALQERDYAAQEYQDWRRSLVETCRGQIEALQPELASVKLKRQFVEKYRSEEAFQALGETEKAELLEQIAPLVASTDADEMAKRFDNFAYSMVLNQMEGDTGPFKKGQQQLFAIATALADKISIPQVNEKLPLLQRILDHSFWEDCGPLQLEDLRQQLRGLINFLDEEDAQSHRVIVTNLTDPVLERKEGQTLGPGYNFDNYRDKVNRYITENPNVTSIFKLVHNIPLTVTDYQELERILTSELGTKEEYRGEFGDTPLGLLVRQVAKLDPEAAMQAFSAFINDQSLNRQQIAFVERVISFVEANGYMESASDLTKPPFDRPMPMAFIRLFNDQQQLALIDAVEQVRKNAEIPAS